MSTTDAPGGSGFPPLVPAPSVVPPPPSATAQYEAPPPSPNPEQAPWWKSRVVLVGSVVAAVVGVIGLAVGIVAFVGSSSTRSDVDEAEAATEEALAQVDEFDQRQEAVAARVEDLTQATEEVATASEAFDAATLAAVGAYNVFIDSMDTAVGLYNAGDEAGAQAQARQQGAAASRDFADAVNAELAALTDLQSAVDSLQEVVGND